MKNCFNQILICLNITDSLHIGFAILDGIRNNFESSYPTFLMRIFPYFHYPFYRYSPFSLQQLVTILFTKYIPLFWMWASKWWLKCCKTHLSEHLCKLINMGEKIVKDFLTLFGNIVKRKTNLTRISRFS